MGCRYTQLSVAERRRIERWRAARGNVRGTVVASAGPPDVAQAAPREEAAAAEVRTRAEHPVSPGRRRASDRVRPLGGRPRAVPAKVRTGERHVPGRARQPLLGDPEEQHEAVRASHEQDRGGDRSPALRRPTIGDVRPWLRVRHLAAPAGRDRDTILARTIRSRRTRKARSRTPTVAPGAGSRENETSAR